MKLIAAMDLLQGQVVRGVGGRRENYRPVVSRLASSAHPIIVAQAFQSLGIDDLYVADLDALAGCDPCIDIFHEIKELGCKLWLDAGAKDLESLRFLEPVKPCQLIAGYETWSDPRGLAPALAEFSHRLTFSLDLRNGQPMVRHAGWDCETPWEIVEKAASMGVRQFLVLDVARVGMGAGLGSLELCSRLKGQFPGIQVFAGGGVKSAQDLSLAQAAGVDGVVMASALHDLSIHPSDFSALG